MARNFNDVFRDAAALSENDRAALAGLLIESLEEETDSDVEAAWAAEIERRIAELDVTCIHILAGTRIDRDGAGADIQIQNRRDALIFRNG